ncbi:MAG: glycosyltransferase [Nitratireductor sp.]|nr:glycosyltransferase [Nitratireductor sp.]
MSRDSRKLRYLTGVSWPRSGHHLLTDLLSAYFGDRFAYCEFYSAENCCRSVPCRAGNINLSKNHDYNGSVPVLSNSNYLVQYRRFAPALVSNYELHVRNTNKDDPEAFRSFAEAQKKRYLHFMARWAETTAPGATFLSISYEQLTSAPEQILRLAIGQFDPGADIDEAKLASVIARADRRTIETRREVISREVGVAQWRDVSKFRHFDPVLFDRLEAETSHAYEKMASLPPVRTAAPGLFTGSQASRPDLYIDVTDAQFFAGMIPSGIPRLQSFIARKALGDPDPRIRCVRFDRANNCYRTVLPQAIETHSGIGAGYGLAKLPRNMSQVLKTIRVEPFLDQKFDRMSAIRLATGGRKGSLLSDKNDLSATQRIKYQLFKGLVRSLRVSAQLFRWVIYRGHVSVRVPSDGLVLLSHAATSGGFLARCLNATNERAIIVHDDIPLRHPEFLPDAATAEQRRHRLQRLIATSAVVLCNSNHTEKSVREHLKGARIMPRLCSFAMPSILHALAGREGRTGRLTAEEPFILYCSTIEIRKNHLMLARIWKRALESGDPLPKLVCVGKWGWGVEPLKAFMAAHPELAEHVRFAGAMDDHALIDLYRSAEFSVFPSCKEGWGMGASESLDFGLPVIVSTAPALVEAVRGLMPAVDPADEDGWEREIRRLARDRQAREELRLSIERHYGPISEDESWEQIKRALLSF